MMNQTLEKLNAMRLTVMEQECRRQLELPAMGSLSFEERLSMLVDAMLRAQRTEESAYRSCMGVLQMAKKHGNSQLEKACEQARKLGSPTYTMVKHLILNPMATKPSAPLPAHENLRDPAEFA